jgi:flagellar biogenesis protein FliO
VMLTALAALGCAGMTGEAHAEKLLEWSSESPAPSAPPSESAVVVASFDDAPIAAAQPPTLQDPRRMAPQSSAPRDESSPGRTNAQGSKPATSLPQIESLTTAGTGLAIVVGLFLICMWLMRRSGPKPTTPLPAEAVAVLGRVPLANQGFAQLIQIGNKLVLVGITADSLTPLTEVTDPTEVERLLSLCHRNRKQSTTAEFQQVLQRLSQEPAQGFLENESRTAYDGASR